jgi:hypothetical protein
MKTSDMRERCPKCRFAPFGQRGADISAVALGRSATHRATTDIQHVGTKNSVFFPSRRIIRATLYNIYFIIFIFSRVFL